MTVFADTPRWPRHGTVWGHLISDLSLEELHESAARAGLPARAFDLDHYDWPLSMREGLAAAGVTFVGDRELTRILIRSGLRIPLVDRPAARAERTARDLEAIGLVPSAGPEPLLVPPPARPRDFLWGPRGHVDPLPASGDAPPGAFRMTCEGAGAEPRIEAHDRQGRADALRLAEQLHRLAREAGHAEGYVGQLLVVPEGPRDRRDRAVPGAQADPSARADPGDRGESGDPGL